MIMQQYHIMKNPMNRERYYGRERKKYRKLIVYA